jgi:2,5-diketo-D-gluconate reductase A
MPTAPTWTLNDGHPLPMVGFGTYPLRGAEARESVDSAVALGYRLIDSAVNYNNEAEVGAGIRDAGPVGDDLVLTTKLPGRDQGYEKTLDSVERSRSELGVDRIGLYLIHWPNPSQGLFLDSWRAMIELRERGLVRSIGVSNFTIEHLQTLIDATGVAPAVNQVELHPLVPQSSLRAFHRAHGIVTQSWSPLGQGNGLLEAAPITAVAARLGVSPGRAVLRWHVQLGSVPIPKSSSAKRQADNLDLFDFELSDADVAAISSLESGRIGGDPVDHEEF